MLLEIFLALLLGIFTGTITGLFPGIHINLVGIIIVTLSASLLNFINPIYLVVFIVSMAITHTFVDFIPSIFLGCSNTDTELSILPGHELLYKGKGYEAVLLTSYGCIFATFIFILLSPLLVLTIPAIYSLLKNIIVYLLIIVSISVIFTEKNKFKALFCFLLTGVLGLGVLNLEVKEPLLPLLTGLFGSSTIILSIKDKIKIPKQKITNPDIEFHKPLIASIISSPLSIFLPALGSNQIAVIGNLISKTERKGFLFLIGAVNVFVMCFSFIAFYSISKTRTGAAVSIKNLIGNLTPKIFILILVVCLISGIISFFITKYLAKSYSKYITRFEYSKISIVTLIILIGVVFVVTGFYGLIILTTSTLAGIFCILTGVKRTNMMGGLLVPTILWYIL